MRPAVRIIQAACAAHWGVEVEWLRSARRPAPVVLPRQTAMWLVRALLAPSLPQIGRDFGGRDHTTVLHGCLRTDARLAADWLFCCTVAALGRRVAAAMASREHGLDLQREDGMGWVEAAGAGGWSETQRGYALHDHLDRKTERPAQAEASAGAHPSLVPMADPRVPHPPGQGRPAGAPPPAVARSASLDASDEERTLAAKATMDTSAPTAPVRAPVPSLPADVPLAGPARPIAPRPAAAPWTPPRLPPGARLIVARRPAATVDLGDPPPGRSALDQRRLEQAEARA